MRMVPSATELGSAQRASSVVSPNSWRMPTTLVTSSPARKAATIRSHQMGAVASSSRIKA